VKIGRAQDPAARLRDLQTSHYQQLTLSYTRECAPVEANAVERRAHQALAERKLYGEWFSVSIEEAQSVIDDAHAVIREQPSKSYIRRRESSMDRILRAMLPLTEVDLGLMAELVSFALKKGSPTGYGISVSIAKGRLKFYSTDSALVESLERLRRFSVFWSERRYSAGFNAITTYSHAEETHLEVMISGCIREICNLYGKPRLFAVVREQVARIMALRQEDQAA
jgi:hypothetical protein